MDTYYKTATLSSPCLYDRKTKGARWTRSGEGKRSCAAATGQGCMRAPGGRAGRWGEEPSQEIAIDTKGDTLTRTGGKKHAEECLLEVRTGGWERGRLREDNRERHTRICVYGERKSLSLRAFTTQRWTMFIGADTLFRTRNRVRGGRQTRWNPKRMRSATEPTSCSRVGFPFFFHVRRHLLPGVCGHRCSWGASATHYTITAGK